MICTIFSRLACKSKCNRIHFKALYWLGTIISTDKSLKHLKSKDKFLIANVSNYFEKHSGRDSSSYIQQTIQATGVSRRTFFRVRKELRETGTLSSPRRSKRGQNKSVDDFDETVIRNKVQEFYTHRHQLPTINNLLSVLKTDINYPGSREHLRQTLRKLGFAWKRTSDNRKVLIEKSAIIAQRLAFYGRKKELDDKGYNIVYVDETWIDTAYTVNRCWQRQDMPGIQAPCNRGQRLIVVHAGSHSGFVKGAQLI